MPARNQAEIRRYLVRLKDIVDAQAPKNAVFVPLKNVVDDVHVRLEGAWKRFQEVSLRGDQERSEREDALGELRRAVQSWRPMLMLVAPAAKNNVRTLPPNGGTPTDLIRVAEDIRDYIQTDAAVAARLSGAVDALDAAIRSASKETDEATLILSEESAAREALSAVSIEANTTLVLGSDVVLATLGSASPEYRSLRKRSSAAENDQADKDVEIGEAPVEGAAA